MLIHPAREVIGDADIQHPGPTCHDVHGEAAHAPQFPTYLPFSARPSEHSCHPERTGPFRLSQTGRTHFAALAERIHYQQLAGAAAAAIHGRFIALFDGKPVPETVLAMHPRRLRAAGLSQGKVASLRDPVSAVSDGGRLVLLARRP